MVSLWLRIGDGAEYEAHGDDLNGVAEAIACYDLGPLDSLEWRRGGFTTELFDTNNYISLYWGDREANFSHDLDKHEKAALLKTIQRIQEIQRQ